MKWELRLYLLLMIIFRYAHVAIYSILESGVSADEILAKLK